MKTMRAANIIEKDVILNIDETIAAEMEFYEQVLKKFKSKYGDLIEFESKMANAELPEHPNWEKSGSLVIPVKSISMINQVNKEYPFKSRCMR